MLAACLLWEIIPRLACPSADSSGRSHLSPAQAFLWAPLSAALPYLLAYLAVPGAPSQLLGLVMVESSPREPEQNWLSDVAQTAHPGLAVNDV